MDAYAELALAKQSFEMMLSLCDPRLIRTWNPSREQRIAYARFADQALDGMVRFEQLERRQLLSEGVVQSFVPEAILKVIREQMKPLINDIHAALNFLDP